MAYYAVPEAFLCYLEYGTDGGNTDLSIFTKEELEACDRFLEKFYGFDFEIFTDPDTDEWPHSITENAITGEKADCVYIYTDPEDYQDLLEMFGLDRDNEEDLGDELSADDDDQRELISFDDYRKKYLSADRFKTLFSDDFSIDIHDVQIDLKVRGFPIPDQNLFNEFTRQQADPIKRQEYAELYRKAWPLLCETCAVQQLKRGGLTALCTGDAQTLHDSAAECTPENQSYLKEVLNTIKDTYAEYKEQGRGGR